VLLHRGKEFFRNVLGRVEQNQRRGRTSVSATAAALPRFASKQAHLGHGHSRVVFDAGRQTSFQQGRVQRVCEGLIGGGQHDAWVQHLWLGIIPVTTDQPGPGARSVLRWLTCLLGRHGGA
jgi:hypothetical protein